MWEFAPSLEVSVWKADTSISPRVFNEDWPWLINQWHSFSTQIQTKWEFVGTKIYPKLFTCQRDASCHARLGDDCLWYYTQKGLLWSYTIYVMRYTCKINFFLYSFTQQTLLTLSNNYHDGMGRRKSPFYWVLKRKWMLMCYSQSSLKTSSSCLIFSESVS